MWATRPAAATGEHQEGPTRASTGCEPEFDPQAREIPGGDIWRYHPSHSVVPGDPGYVSINTWKEGDFWASDGPEFQASS
jgi:hypothetical protein